MSEVDEVKAKMNEILDNAEREINEIVRSYRITVEDFRRDPTDENRYMYDTMRNVYNERTGAGTVRNRIDTVVNNVLNELRTNYPFRDNND